MNEIERLRRENESLRYQLDRVAGDRPSTMGEGKSMDTIRRSTIAEVVGAQKSMGEQTVSRLKKVEELEDLLQKNPKVLRILELMRELGV